MSGCVSHDHDCGDVGCAGSSLFKSINHAAVRCLNAADPGSAPLVLRPWERRHEREPALDSNEDDGELLLHIPFVSDVKLQGIVVAGGPEGSSPTSMRVFINRDDLDFGLAGELPALQEWSLSEDGSANLEYQTRFSRFQCVSSLDIHFPGNGGAARTCVFFVGLRGVADPHASREALTNVVYESRPRPQDHRTPAGEAAHAQRLGQ